MSVRANNFFYHWYSHFYFGSSGILSTNEVSSTEGNKIKLYFVKLVKRKSSIGGEKIKNWKFFSAMLFLLNGDTFFFYLKLFQWCSSVNSTWSNKTVTWSYMYLCKLHEKLSISCCTVKNYYASTLTKNVINILQ